MNDWRFQEARRLANLGDRATEQDLARCEALLDDLEADRHGARQDRAAQLMRQQRQPAPVKFQVINHAEYCRQIRERNFARDRQEHAARQRAAQLQAEAERLERATEPWGPRDCYKNFWGPG